MLLLAALSIVTAFAQDDTVPRALPVGPETDTPAPKAVPVAAAPVDPEVKAPRAELVLPGDPETLPPDQQPKKALPVEPVAPKATAVVPIEGATNPTEIPKAQPVLKQPKGEFKPPPSFKKKLQSQALAAQIQLAVIVCDLKFLDLF